MTGLKKTHLLCILDGFGYRKDSAHNAITPETAPFFHEMLERYPSSLLKTDGEDVGLPAGQMGNSEVGHMNLGAGRIVYQDLPKINKAIQNNELANNPEMISFINKLRTSGGTCHLMGLASPGGVHAHEDHILALAKVVSDANIPVMLHFLLDGRDTPPQSALETLPPVIKKARELSGVSIGSLCGRYYAMDRDNRWERIEDAYNLFTSGEEAIVSLDAMTALEESYDLDRHDEFIEPIVLPEFKPMQDGDGLLMANFRADRARQILTALLDPEFSDFKREKVVKFAATLGMVEYSAHLNKFLPALFPATVLKETLGAIISEKGMTQLRIAETEKYAHVTYFFNGGAEEPFTGETRIMVPSPKVATYDLQPEMSAPEVTEKLLAAIKSRDYDFIVVNFANGDMVGHTGKFEAAQKAVRTLDAILQEVVNAIKDVDGVMFMTADHGNCEEMYDPETSGAHTAHTLNAVPAILVNGPKNVFLKDGRLADVAPTFLDLMDIEQPSVMDGKTLLEKEI